LISIYNGADLFIFLSLYEGFGLPPLEAMACGVPVVVSNVSSLPEVVGAAGILVNPLNIDEIVDAIIKIISDMKLKKELSEKGLKRAKEFSWQKTAIETLSVYKELC
jgi:glycosyltransferase involved in cell wall biosynthesis